MAARAETHGPARHAPDTPHASRRGPTLILNALDRLHFTTPDVPALTPTQFPPVTLVTLRLLDSTLTHSPPLCMPSYYVTVSYHLIFFSVRTGHPHKGGLADLHTRDFFL